MQYQHPYCSLNCLQPYLNQGLSQDLDSRVSKMDFGGDRVSWWANAARSMRLLEERPPLTAGGLGPAQGPQKPEGLGALKCILWLFLALIFIILHIEMYVFSVWIIHFIDIFPGMSNLNNFSIAILHTRMDDQKAGTDINFKVLKFTFPKHIVTCQKIRKPPQLPIKTCIYTVLLLLPVV